MPFPWSVVAKVVPWAEVAKRAPQAMRQAKQAYAAHRAGGALVRQLDHLVLTTAHKDACLAFYTGVLGMTLHTFGDGRLALHFGQQKINLHIKGQEFEPKATHPVPGALDLCFLSVVPLADVVQRLQQAGVPILEGPVPRTGAVGPMRSVYVRDPDGNLIEISEPTN